MVKVAFGIEGERGSCVIQEKESSKGGGVTSTGTLRPKHQEGSAPWKKCQERKVMGTHLQP